MKAALGASENIFAIFMGSKHGLNSNPLLPTAQVETQIFHAGDFSGRKI